MPVNSRTTSTSANSTVVDDFPWATNTTGRVSTSGAPTTGNIQFAGDQDLFAIELLAGVSYNFTLNRGSKSGVDPMLTLHGASGKVMSQDTGGKSTQSAGLQFTPSTSGTYYLGAQDQVGTGTGAYTVRAQAVDDVPHNVVKFVPLGATTSGRIEAAGDIDRYAVDLQAGSTYVFTLESDKLAAGLDPRLQLSSKNGGKGGGGTKIASDDDSGNPLTGAARIQVTPGSSGTYYLDALGESSAATGGYLLTATLVGAPPPAASVQAHPALDLASIPAIDLIGVASAPDSL